MLMACIITEVCLLVLGIITLVKGQINISKDKMVVGVPARWIGAVLLLPLPLSLAVGFGWGIILAAQGRIPDRKELQTTGAIIEISIFAVCILAAVIIAAASEKVPVVKPEKRRERVEEEYEEEEAYPVRPRPAERDAIREEHITQESTPEPVRESSPTPVQCTFCKGTVGIPQDALGKSVKCPLCSTVFVAQATPPPVRVQCSHCKKDLSVPVSALGKSVKCPLCTGVFTAQLSQDTGFTA
jgi:hypothetical protein